MEKSPHLPTLPGHDDFESQAGVRQLLRKLYNYERDLRTRLEGLFVRVAAEITPLYAELVYSAGAPANGAQTLLTVTVAGAIPGYRVAAIYDQDLQGLLVQGYVSAIDTVIILLRNETGGAITLSPGKLRVLVWASLTP